MPKGFFASSLVKSSKRKAGLIPKCGACALYKKCNSPKMPVFGRGARRVLIVGDAPGQADDIHGEPFSGESGQLLRSKLRSIGVDLERDCWSTNALICRPPRGESPSDKQIDFCRPNILGAIRKLEPDVVILLGIEAVKSVIGEYWDDKIGSISRWVGWRIPLRSPRMWLCPIANPEAVLKDRNKMTERFFTKHLKQAFELKGKPWPDGVEDYESKVEVVLDSSEAARIIRKMNEKGGLLSFDFENTCLKPEYTGGEIVCCSVSWEGKKTIAFIWQGEVVEAMRELLHGKSTLKVASNLKHEDRWTRRVFGKGVRGWAWDTMLAAHVIDNREGITGLKFQAFVYLGIEAYNDKIKEFLSPSNKDKHLNRVKSDVDMTQLLRYCGTDSILEMVLARIQMKILGRQSLLLFHK